MTYFSSLEVPKAAAFLDREVPHWERVIDIESLDMSSSNYCVLGQIARAHSRFEGYSFVANPWLHATTTLGIAWGGAFGADMLRDVWLAEIAARVNADE